MFNFRYWSPNKSSLPKKATMTKNGTGIHVLKQILWHDLTNGKENREIFE
jgi:hypothetical protein